MLGSYLFVLIPFLSYPTATESVLHRFTLIHAGTRSIVSVSYREMAGGRQARTVREALAAAMRQHEGPLG